MTDPTVTTAWQATLARLADGLDLDTGEGVNEFRWQARQALHGVPLDVLGEVAESVGARTSPLSEEWVTDAILRNYTAAATGLGTDVDIDAHTHCPLCRSAYRRLPARAESLWIAHNICTDCGYFTAARDEHGQIVDERPADDAACTADASCGEGAHTYTWPCDYAPGTGRLATYIAPSTETRTETRGRRLARAIDPYVGAGALSVPPLRRAVANRVMETIGSALDRVADDAPVLRHRIALAAWDVTSTVHRRLLRSPLRDTAVTRFVNRRASAASLWEATAREAKDGQI